MTCAECELLLAQDEIVPEVEEHVSGCSSCRSLATELQANAHAMRALGAEHVSAPPMRVRPSYPWWKWTSAAAALIVTFGAAWFVSRPPKPPQIVSIDVNVTGVVPATVPVEKAAIPQTIASTVAYTEPLRVKMLTPDPDVVIYWLIEPKGE